MGWETRIISEAALSPYLDHEAAPGLRAQVDALIAQQQTAWPMLREAIAGLAEVEYQQFNVRGSEVFAQFNPKRIVSTAARVDATTIKQRPCFLCPENLPPEEKGITFGPEFIVLCNPFPVLRRHLVIASRRHTPQTIAGNFGALLDLAQGLGADYFALYNGPACGASAPDHLHFQACSRELLPIIREAETWQRHQLSGAGELEIFTLPDYRVNLLVACGKERSPLITWFERTTACLAAVTGGSDPEPMLNLVVTFGPAGWTILFFPRGKHRPACYYADGEAKLTVSPAAIDLAGVLVVPDASHFARISERDIEQIYLEVTLDTPRFAEWLRLCGD